MFICWCVAVLVCRPSIALKYQNKDNTQVNAQQTHAQITFSHLSWDDYRCLPVDNSISTQYSRFVVLSYTRTHTAIEQHMVGFTHRNVLPSTTRSRRAIQSTLRAVASLLEVVCKFNVDLFIRGEAKKSFILISSRQHTDVGSLTEEKKKKIENHFGIAFARISRADKNRIAFE